MLKPLRIQVLIYNLDTMLPDLHEYIWLICMHLSALTDLNGLFISCLNGCKSNTLFTASYETHMLDQANECRLYND